MKAEKNRFAPRLESLESIVALSGLSPSAATVVAAQAKTITLSGSASGLYHAHEIPDAGKTYTFTNGKGHASPIGKFHVTGNVQLPGLLVSPGGPTNPVYANGTLVVSNAKGSLTLHLTAPSSDNASSLPRTFSYTITGATGNYRGATGKGWVAIQTIPVTATNMPGGSEHGKFNLEFLTAAPPTTTV